MSACTSHKDSSNQEDGYSIDHGVEQSHQGERFPRQDDVEYRRSSKDRAERHHQHEQCSRTKIRRETRAHSGSNSRDDCDRNTNGQD
jgi:hypothetical protein